MTDYVFEREGRSQTTVVVLILIYAALLYAWRSFDAAWWVLALLFLPTLPALWDLWHNPRSGLRLTDTEIPLRRAMNALLLEAYHADCTRIVARWNRTLTKLEVDARIDLPNLRFNRNIGIHADASYDPAGNPIS